MNTTSVMALVPVFSRTLGSAANAIWMADATAVVLAAGCGELSKSSIVLSTGVGDVVGLAVGATVEVGAALRAAVGGTGVPTGAVALALGTSALEHPSR